MSRPQALLQDLRANQCMRNPGAYWPEADSILAQMPATPDKQLGTFMAHAIVWTCSRFETPWAPETHEFFALQLREKDAQRSIDGMDALLRLWTKAGALLPEQPYQNEIGSYLSRCDVATGTRLLSFAPGAAATMAPPARRTWVRQATPYAQLRPDSPQSPLALFAYFNGRHDALTQEQRDVGLQWTVNPSKTWPPPWTAGPLLALHHPEPGRLQLAFLHRILHAAFRQQNVPAACAEFQTAFQHTVAGWPPTPCSQTVQHQTHVLVLGALFERFVPGTLGCLAGQWALVQEMLPVVESMHTLQWSPSQSEHVVSELACTLMPLLGCPPEEVATAPLPTDLLASP